MAKKLRLSRHDKKIAGVCAGLAEYFEIDPLIVRIVFLVAALGYGIGVLPYVILWLAMPSE